jgi:hypothetical protein
MPMLPLLMPPVRFNVLVDSRVDYKVCSCVRSPREIPIDTFSATVLSSMMS